MKFRRDVTKYVKEKLREQFEVEVDLKFHEGGKGKIYAYRHELPDFLKRYLVQSGIYFGRIERDGIRLSLDGCALVKNAEKCTAELSDSEALSWMAGEDIKVDESKLKGCRYVLLRWRKFSAGCGKVAGNGRIKNFVPKNRRVEAKY